MRPPPPVLTLSKTLTNLWNSSVGGYDHADSTLVQRACLPSAPTDAEKISLLLLSTQQHTKTQRYKISLYWHLSFNHKTNKKHPQNNRKPLRPRANAKDQGCVQNTQEYVYIFQSASCNLLVNMALQMQCEATRKISPVLSWWYFSPVYSDETQGDMTGTPKASFQGVHRSIGPNSTACDLLKEQKNPGEFPPHSPLPSWLMCDH